MTMLATLKLLGNVVMSSLLMLIVQLTILVFILHLIWVLRYWDRPFVEVFSPDVLAGIVSAAAAASLVVGIWTTVDKALRNSR
jgi:hypothetical protein